MIIWNKEKNIQEIRIGGQVIASISDADINKAGSNSEVEAKVKTAIDSKASASKGYHCYIHLVSKSPVSYSTWLGPNGIEPVAEWWKFGKGKKVKVG